MKTAYLVKNPDYTHGGLEAAFTLEGVEAIVRRMMLDPELDYALCPWGVSVVGRVDVDLDNLRATAHYRDDDGDPETSILELTAITVHV